MYEKIIEIPEGIEVKIENKKIIVSGKNGENTRDFDDPRYNHIVDIKNEENSIKVSAINDGKIAKKMAGTFAAHIRNMINGVNQEYEYKMKICYNHFPISAEVKENRLHIKNFLGEKQDRISKIRENVNVQINGDELIVSGVNKEDVGQTCADIENTCKIRKKDRRVFGDGIFITSKGE